MRRVRIGIAGVAHPHAQSYASALKMLEQVVFLSVFDPSRERANAFSSSYGISSYSDLDEMLRKEKLDAVIIVSENVRHASYAVQAMEAGVDVLCEVPIATSMEDADNMLSVQRKSGVVFQTCFVMRYHTAAQIVKEIIDSGTIGDVMSMAGTNRLNIDRILIEPWFTDPSLSGGGAVMDRTVHLADTIRWYIGEEVDQVYTEIGPNIFSGLKVEDNFFTLLKFNGGRVGSIDGSWCMPSAYPSWGEFTVSVYGTDGMIEFNAFKQNVTLISVKEPDGGVKWHYYACNPDLEMIRDFVKCLVEPSREPRATIEDGRKGTEITVASYLSAKRGEPVRIPLR